MRCTSRNLLSNQMPNNNNINSMKIKVKYFELWHLSMAKLKEKVTDVYSHEQSISFESVHLVFVALNQTIRLFFVLTFTQTERLTVLITISFAIDRQGNNEICKY